MIGAQGDLHDLRGPKSTSDVLWLSTGSHGEKRRNGRADGKDASLGGVDDSSEMIDAKHPHIRDGESATLVLFTLEFSITRLFSESFCLS